MFVSRLSATEEYLGKGYPMFYNELEEIETIINNRELLHQKYTIPGAMKIAIYDNRIEIFNPGCFPGLVDINSLGDGTTYLRNPTLVRLAYQVNLIEARGTGIRLIYESCKKAGIALAYKAIEEKDKVGMIIFGKEVHKKIMPTRNFNELLNEIATIRASNETDLAVTIRESVRMFPTTDVTKHLVLITDAMPTAGDSPTKETIKAAEIAKAHDITISLVGIKLEKDGIKLAKNITQIGGGKLHVAKDLDNVDQIVLEDYYAVKEGY